MRRRPRIAVDLRSLVGQPTGIGVYTLEIVRALAAADEFEIVGTAHREPSVADQLRAAGCAIEVEPAPLGLVWQQVLLPRRLAKGDIDLFWSPLLTLPRRLPIAGVVTIHDLASLQVPETLPWKVRWSILPFLESTVAAAARIVVPSEWIASEIALTFPSARTRTRVIHHGVSPLYSPGTPDQVAQARARFEAPDGYLLAVGTLEPRKNLSLLLEAWPAIRSEVGGETAQLRIAGPAGWKDGALLRSISNLSGDGVRALGRLSAEDLLAAYRGAIALVYPSVYEGFGMPVSEAMACGVPVVVASDSSPAEVAGDAAWHFEQHSPNSLAGTVLEALASPPAHDRRRQAALRIARGFSWPAAAAAHAALFHEALSERKE